MKGTGKLLLVGVDSGRCWQPCRRLSVSKSRTRRQLVKNLLNPDYELVKHVKDITVVEFGRFKEPWNLGVSELEVIIGNISWSLISALGAESLKACLRSHKLSNRLSGHVSGHSEGPCLLKYCPKMSANKFGRTSHLLQV